MKSGGSVSSKKSLRAAAAVILAAVAMTSCVSTGMKGPPKDQWPLYGGDWGNTRYSTLTAINTGNVGKLGGSWLMKLKGENGTSTPVVQDGVMYVIAGSHVYALDARSGEVR